MTYIYILVCYKIETQNKTCKSYNFSALIITITVGDGGGGSGDGGGGD
jgi:hypothetical protein